MDRIINLPDIWESGFYKSNNNLKHTTTRYQNSKCFLLFKWSRIAAALMVTFAIYLRTAIRRISDATQSSNIRFIPNVVYWSSGAELR